MKKLLLAGVTAICLLALSHQQASAWTKFGISGSFRITYESGGKKLCWTSENPPFCGVPSCGYGVGGYDGYGLYAGYANPAATQMPQAQAYAPQGYSPYQTVGYYTPYYGSYGVPSYWYGR